MENNNYITEEIGSKYIDKAIQTAGGDNEFILQLRDIDIENKTKKIKELEIKLAGIEKKVQIMQEILNPHLVEGSDVYYDYKFAVEQGISADAPLAKDPTT